MKGWKLKMLRTRNKITSKRGFVLVLSLGVLAVLFILVFALAGLAMNNRVQSSAFANRKVIRAETERFMDEIVSAIKSGKQPALEQKSIENPAIQLKSELVSAAQDTPIYGSNGLKFKNGDQILTIWASSQVARLTIESKVLLNLGRPKNILISEKTT